MDNVYHRYLNLPFEIARPPIVAYEVSQDWKQTTLRGKYQDPNVEAWFKKLGLECLKTEVFYTPPMEVYQFILMIMIIQAILQMITLK